MISQIKNDEKDKVVWLEEEDVKNACKQRRVCEIFAQEKGGSA